MANPSAFASCYTAPIVTAHSDLAKDIFTEALTAFTAELSKDKTKLKWILDSNFCSLPEVLTSVVEARVQYETRKGDSKVKEKLCLLAEKIHYYGAIMDVMVQHHPEYTALAWGAMKVLFVGVVNQQTLLSRLSTGLYQIADLLPRAGLILTLYPTEEVRHAIVTMYANILKFLLRALRWYQESRLSHMIHAITRPAELRYDDLLRNISLLSRNLTEMALVSSLAEQRDVHTKIEQHITLQKSMQLSIGDLTTLVLQMKEAAVAERVLNASARIEVRQSLSEIQLSQFLSSLSGISLRDPTSVLQASVFMRNRRRGRSTGAGLAFWLDADIQNWNCASNSSLVMIAGTRKLRFHIKDFCVDSISILRETNVPVIWALKTMIVQDSMRTEVVISSIVLLKYLIAQAIKINTSLHKDTTLAPRLQTYMAADTEAEWLNILASVLQGIPLIYIIIDVELLDCSLAELTDNFSWPDSFLKLFSQLAQRNLKTVVKVVLVSYGSPLFKKPMSKECQRLVVPVARTGLLKPPGSNGRATFSNSARTNSARAGLKGISRRGTLTLLNQRKRDHS